MNTTKIKNNPFADVEALDQILTPAEVCSLLRISRSSLWRYERAGLLPRRIHLSNRKTGFFASEVRAALVQLADGRQSESDCTAP
jgi:predicted DNA-binding transcriptional regulator AlpA